MSSIKRIGVLTSGGDAPGMNAAIRSVVRASVEQGIEVFGIYDGYMGLYENDIKPLTARSVSEIINKGGTFLGSARFPEFREQAIREKAVENLKSHNIDALVVIGGDGSYMGAKALTEMGFPCIGLPGTIDNDVNGTDYTIGFYTALNTVLEAIDRLRDTSSSHNRISLVEIMGRHCGDLTMLASIGGGAEYCIIPEKEFDEDSFIRKLSQHISTGKKHAIVAVTEHVTNIDLLAKRIESETGLETRATILGHIQRGGPPTAFDRILASRMGAFAVDLLVQGHGGRCIGIEKDALVHHDIIDAIENMKKPFSKELFDLSIRLA